jgi:hypothetical protein
MMVVSCQCQRLVQMMQDVRSGKKSAYLQADGENRSASKLETVGEGDGHQQRTGVRRTILVTEMEGERYGSVSM